MIVCSCNVLSDRDVRAALASKVNPPRTADEVYGCLGCSPRCGRCRVTIRGIIDQAVAAPPAAETQPAETGGANGNIVNSVADR